MEKSNVFILQEVIDELVYPSVTLVSPLLKLKYFSLLIQNQFLLDYSTNEIEGYSLQDTIPPYRIDGGTLSVSFIDNFDRRHTQNIPKSFLQTDPLNILQQVKFREGIGILEQMRNELKNDSSEKNRTLAREVPMEMFHLIQPIIQKLFNNQRLSIQEARVLINKYKPIDILNSLRSKLLKVCMEVGEEFGFNVKIDSFKNRQTENNTTIISIVKTEISNSGSGNTVNTGNDSILDMNWQQENK